MYLFRNVSYVELIHSTVPISVCAQSKARIVFAYLNTKIVDSNPTQGMDVCVYSLFVLGSGLAMG
jgi:hypothetical protein